MKNHTIILLSIVFLSGSYLNSFGQTDTLDYETSPFQLTFLFPPFSTNGMDNANYVNNVSINLFAGVSGGVDGIEMGGFINVDRFFMSGIQLAGFGNTVGGYADGIQMAGFYNAVGGDVRYVQGAGFVNVTGGKQDGLQGAGFMNVVGRDLFGFQGAGFANVVGGKMIGIQGAGFMNVTGGETMGLQGAGFVNVAGNFKNGVQAAGFGNVAGNGTVNLQASGFFNIADEVDGAQLAGFINRAAYVKGLQAAGFINICDSIDGVPIAFISIVRKNGYRKLEIAASETQYANLSFKMGIEKFYTLYSFGKAFGPSTRWMYGAGIGSQLSISERSFLNIEATTEQELWIGDNRAPWFVYQTRFNSLNQLRIAYGRSLGNFADFFIGPTFNVSVAHTHPADDVYIPWEPVQPNWAFYDNTYNNYHNTNVSFWVGVRGGLRF